MLNSIETMSLESVLIAEIESQNNLVEHDESSIHLGIESFELVELLDELTTYESNIILINTAKTIQNEDYSYAEEDQQKGILDTINDIVDKILELIKSLVTRIQLYFDKTYQHYKDVANYWDESSAKISVLGEYVNLNKFMDVFSMKGYNYVGDDGNIGDLWKYLQQEVFRTRSLTLNWAVDMETQENLKEAKRKVEVYKQRLDNLLVTAVHKVDEPGIAVTYIAKKSAVDKFFTHFSKDSLKSLKDMRNAIWESRKTNVASPEGIAYFKKHVRLIQEIIDLHTRVYFICARTVSKLIKCVNKKRKNLGGYYE